MQHDYEAGLECADQVAATGTSEPSISQIIEEVYRVTNRPDKLRGYFEEMVKQKPKDFEILQSYFDNMLIANDISGLQKASMALSKLGARDYKLWAVACLFLAIKQDTVSAVEKKVFPKLASGLIKQLEPFQSAQEGYLNALVLQINEDEQGLLSFLQSKQVQEWDLLDLNILLVETLDKNKNWDGLKTQCIKILKELKRDDFNHWKALIKACIALNDVEFVRNFIAEYPKGQNSALALVCLANETDLKDMSLNKAAEQFFAFMGSKRSTFNDLQPYILSEKFDKAAWIKYLESVVADPKDQNLIVNVEKFKFYLRNDKYDLQEFVTKQAALYKNSRNDLKKKDPKDYHSADDHILIAAHAVLEQGNGSKESLMKAAILLETACAKDQHQFYVRLWLVRIYLLLGAMTKAFSHFKVLRVQRLQVESMSHYILTRAATLFPTDEPMKASQDAYASFNQEFKMGITLVFNKGTYTQLESFMNLRKAIDNSVSRGILNVQLDQVSQFQTVKRGNDTFSALDVEKFLDNRDFDIMFDLPRPGQQKLSHTLTVGPKVGGSWVRTHALKNELVKKLVAGGPELDKLVESFASTLDDKEVLQELTAEEEWSCKVILALGRSAQNKESEQEYQNVYQTFESLKLLGDLSKNNNESGLTRDWKTFHQYLLVLGTYTTISTYTHTLKNKRNQLRFNLSGSQLLTDKLLKLMMGVKDLAGELKNSRAQESKKEVEELEAWCQEVGLAHQIVGDIVDSIYTSQDQALTLVRTKI